MPTATVCESVAFSEQIKIFMHTLRYFAYTLKNAPALIRYRLRALTCLVGRHRRRMSASIRLFSTLPSTTTYHLVSYESAHGGENKLTSD